jgi:hypothetical protein
MLLAPDDAALFYRAWGALLTWVNDRRNIVPRFPRPAPGQPLDASLAVQIKKVIWADDALREQFLAEGASDLTTAERELVASWTHRVSGNFTILRHLKSYSIFMNDSAYAVVGIYTPLAVMFPDVPMFVTAVLIPCGDQIITDGLIQSPGVHLTFGGGARRMFNEKYSALRAESGIRKTLPWQAKQEPGDTAAAGPKAGRTPRRRKAR